MSCGIFGYIGTQNIDLTIFKNILKTLEVLQEEADKTPLGGDGAGLFLIDDGKELVLRSGKEPGKSSVDIIFDKLKEFAPSSQRFFLGHVRRASPQFSDLLSEEYAHPFIVMREDIEIVAIHNGFLSNYKELAQKYRITDFMIDSEVLTKLLLRVISRHRKIANAVQEFFEVIEGNNTGAFFIKKRKDMWLLLLHTGKTRGLTVYENERGALIFCSRESPLQKFLGDFIKNNSFTRTFFIGPKENGNFINWWRVDPQTFKLYEY